jgi:hypothetical protein
MGAACGECGGGLPRAGADLGEPGSRSDFGQLCQIADQSVRVARASSVVQLGVLVEDRSQFLSGHVQHPATQAR